MSEMACSFCGALAKDVAVLVSGPGNIFICDTCTETCRDIVGKCRCKADKKRRKSTNSEVQNG